jgi:hypothetical protein
LCERDRFDNCSKSIETWGNWSDCWIAFLLTRLIRKLDEITLLVDVFSYLTCFPDVRHHPVEDRIVASLLAQECAV